MLIQENKNLKEYNTFMVPCVARYFAVVDDNNSLYKILASSEWSTSVHKIILGGGSNILFVGDYDGFVLKNEIKGIDIVREDTDSVTVRVGAGESWAKFVTWSVQNKYWGIENLAYIPGTVGAAPVQNIGAYGVEAKDTIESVEYISLPDAEKKILFNHECNFEYRNSIFKQNLEKFIITYVYFKLEKDGNPITSYGRVDEELHKHNIIKPTSYDIAQAITNIRKSKLPEVGEIGMAGSFFKNPIISKSRFETIQKLFPSIKSFDTQDGIKIPAGWLLEELGYKGFKKNNVGNYDKHALVVTHNGHGSGMDVLHHIKDIIYHVKDVFDINLEPEVQIIKKKD